MAFDQRDFLPLPSGWFSSDIDYEGWGRAEFSDPKGSLEGPVAIHFDELGGANVEMTPDLSRLQSERPLRFGLDEFLSGEQPTQSDGTYVLSMNPSSRNPCVKLDVETPHGVFSTQDVADYGTSSVYGRNVGAGVEKITFDPLWSQFDAVGSREPKYWVLPLSNFVSDCRWYPPDELNRHPLRIFPTPDVPDEITHWLHGPDQEEHEQRAWLALMAANSKNRLITFEFNDAWGFVERLPEYQDRKESLLAGADQTRLTAVMVGEVGSNPDADFDDLAGWLRPFDLLGLLTLATGTEVGAPWIELRDEEGQLVRRIHRRLREPRFHKGRRVIDELPFLDDSACPTGTGHLITRATSFSEKYGEAFLRVAILNLVRSQYTNQTLEESIVSLCRGLDSLCEHYEVARQNLMERLDAAQQEIVRQALREAAKHIRDLKDAAKAGGDRAASEALATIESRVANASNQERRFGLAVTDLLDLFGMPDANIIDEYYKSNPRADGREHWSDVVSYYRLRVIHHGYLDLSAGGVEWRDVWTVINHLHDIMARIVLQILEYDGGYQPTVIPQRSVPFSLDWVKPDAPAGKLGYEWDRTS